MSIKDFINYLKATPSESVMREYRKMLVKQEKEEKERKEKEMRDLMFKPIQVAREYLQVMAKHLFPGLKRNDFKEFEKRPDLYEFSITTKEQQHTYSVTLEISLLYGKVTIEQVKSQDYGSVRTVVREADMNNEQELLQFFKNVAANKHQMVFHPDNDYY